MAHVSLGRLETPSKVKTKPMLYGTQQLHINVEGGTLHNDVGRIHSDALKLTYWQAIRFMISSQPEADTIIIWSMDAPAVDPYNRKPLPRRRPKRDRSPLLRRPVLSTPSSTTYKTEGPADDSAILDKTKEQSQQIQLVHLHRVGGKEVLLKSQTRATSDKRTKGSGKYSKVVNTETTASSSSTRPKDFD